MKNEFFDLPEEFRQVREINENFKDEFDYHNIPKSVKKNSLKQRYNKLLKIMKLATSVSLTVAVASPSIPTIVPIIKIDASEDERVEEIIEVKVDELYEKLSGSYYLSGYSRFELTDGEEVLVEESNVDNISYSLDLEGEEIYLTYYEDGENLNSSLLEKIDDNTLYTHQVRQNDDEVDIYVYLDGNVLVIKEIINRQIDDLTKTEITYYYCGKDGDDYIFVPSTIPSEDEEKCEVCEGTGFVTCTNCQGVGYVICQICNGSGLTEENCETCDSLGTCIKCEGLGYFEEKTIDEETLEEVINQIECEECKGTGICTTCNGSGKKVCENCYREDEEYLPGYIICELCNKEGKVPCENCSNEDTTNDDEEVIEDEASNIETESE